MKRVAVIGCCGAGKSTFSRRLQEITGLPVHHLDRLLWRPGWVQTPSEEFRASCRAVYAEPEWIVDGNYTSTLEERLARADTVVFLDYSTALCFGRVLRRTWRGRGTNRPDVADGCIERFDREFLLYVLRFRTRMRPRLMRILRAADPSLNIHIARGPGEAEDILEKFAASRTDRGLPSPR